MLTYNNNLAYAPNFRIKFEFYIRNNAIGINFVQVCGSKCYTIDVHIVLYNF